MSVWIRPDRLAPLRAATLVLDLDGVVVDVRSSYRRSYLDGLAWHLRHDLHLPLKSRYPATLQAVHLTKRHPAFNAPAEIVGLLLRLALVAGATGKPLTMQAIDAQGWIDAALAGERLGPWRTTTLADLGATAKAWILAHEQPDRALQCCREAYVGSARVHALFGVAPCRRVAGLWRRDRLLLSPDRPATKRPVAVYTGRTQAEARWLMARFRWFATDCPVQAEDDGLRKPDGTPLRILHDRLGPGPVLYIGDLPADRDALADARRRWPEVTWLLGQILPDARAPRWPEADVAATAIDDLLTAVGA